MSVAFRNHAEELAAARIFLTWELVLFDKLKQKGSIEDFTYESVISDMAAEKVSKARGRQYLDAQIKDMVEQISEQRMNQSREKVNSAGRGISA